MIDSVLFCLDMVCKRRVLILILSLVGLVGCREAARPVSVTWASEDRELLEFCFRTALEESQLGAVLFGGKPICVEYTRTAPYVRNAELGCLGILDVELYRQGLRKWQELGIDGEGNFLFVEYSPELLDETGFVCAWINKRALRAVLEQNIDLFRLALGPLVTAETLFDALTTPGSEFMRVLGHHRALYGIVFGYGVRNAMVVSRELEIENALSSGERLPLNFRAKREPGIDTLQGMTWSRSPTETELEPGLGFVKLVDELEALKSRGYRSIDHPLAKGFNVPLFGCYEDCPENRALIKRYVKADKKTAKLLASPSFLDDFVREFQK